MGPSNPCRTEPEAHSQSRTELANNLNHGRSNTLQPSPSEAFEVIHDDGSDQPQEHSVKLDGRMHRTRWRTINSVKYIPVPRRMPTFTSLMLLELYVTAATPVLVKCLSVPDTVDAMLDEDGYTILLVGKRLRHVIGRDLSLHQSFRSLDATMSQTPGGQKLQARLKWLREGDDRYGNIFQRVVWRYRHPAWHDQSIWNGVASLLLDKYKQKPDDSHPRVGTVRQDWDLCVTYITTMALLSRIDDWREKSWNLFAASIPVAWLARISGRSWLYLPMGGAQRLFLGTFLYSYWASNAGLFQHVKLIRDKAAFARLVTAVFGDLTKDMTGFPKDEGVDLFLELFD
ncbi:hypothetical protein V8D89_004166 [Ganoderma adspersum]